MEAVSGVGSTATSSATGTSSSSFTSRLAQEDFLRLLITQMQQQDPLNPQDPTEFTSQLTQFSQLEQLLNIKKALDEVRVNQKAMESTQLADYIGKSVRTTGSSIQIAGGQSTPITYDLALSAATVTIEVRNASGALVRTIEQSLVAPGSKSVAFDGKDNLGQPLPDGIYGISISAQDAAGKPVLVQLFKTGVVTGVNLQGEEPTLLLGTQQVKLSEVLEISAASGV